MSEKLDIFLTEARNYFDISVETINSYDRKLSQLFTMCTAIIGILFIGASILFNPLMDKDLMLNLNSVISLLWFLSLFLGVGLGIYALGLCLTGLKLQRVNVTNPEKLYKKYGNLNEDELKEFLIIQLGYLFEENTKKMKAIKDVYINSIDALRYSTISTLLLFIFTLMLLRGILITV